MIFYGTKTFMKDFKAGMTGSSELSESVQEKVLACEQGQGLLEWAVHDYYYGRLRCIQIMNIETKMTLFVCQNDIDNIKMFPMTFITILLNLYGDDPKMQEALMTYLDVGKLITYVPLNNKSALTSLSHFKGDFMNYGHVLDQYLDGNKLDIMALNWESSHYLMTKKINGKTEYIVPYKYFKELIIKEYK